MTTQTCFSLNHIHASWYDCINEAIQHLDLSYLENLAQNNDWLPGREKIFNAFSQPIDQVRYVLIGESPYPRAQSANGFAFWDQSVHEIWSPTGFSKSVNRATSLRNIIKMLLVADNILKPNQITQDHIAAINKQKLVQTNAELFGNFISTGFLLLNASLVLQPTAVRKDAVAWQPFIKHVLNHLFTAYPHVQLILLGNIANAIDKLVDHFEIKRLYAEHPYNLSFIHNPDVLDFFKPLHLLVKNEF